ncbi:sodium:proton antiporter [Gloeocapsa sp. PCC 73106]|uniref:cation:proton antiporter n=1 Tax=Gloeocapsa sp. PCC 73106 TaxID=102232 RepID=UPI0002AC1176|nr:sodium:proton antiporter [Gloeocapsa sp. PCC 73106]ELR99114.1 NhaP-type Na+(K+)/H+ antiporter [Gloeocapsa sp. PCC 73106]
MTESLIKENLEQFLIILVISLSVATVSRMFSWLRKIPYTLLLVIVGLGLGFVDVELFELSPELILDIFVPPLLFEAAWNIRWRDLVKDWLPITLFATLGVVIVVVIVAVSLAYFTPISFTTALLIGASLAATDPVAVIALFRDLGTSKRLTILMEGDSLGNDGAAIVAFMILVGVALGQEEFSLATGITRFVLVVGIGAGVGAVISFAVSYLTQRFDLPLVEQSLTLVSAYSTFLIAENLGGSGVIAVVTAGLVLGNFGSRIGMSPRTRLSVSQFWEFLAFFFNSIVFLLIGDQIQFGSLLDNWQLIAVATTAMVLSRLIAIFGLSAISNTIIEEPIDWRDQIILWWGGLRGSISIALALSVPVLITERQDIIDTVFGAVLFTLIIQGLTIKPLLTKLGLISDDQIVEKEYTELTSRLVALRRVSDYLTKMELFPEYEPEYYTYKKSLVMGEIESLETKIKELRNVNPYLQSLTREQIKNKLIDIEAETYAEFINAGVLKENLFPLLKEVEVES